MACYRMTLLRRYLEKISYIRVTSNCGWQRLQNNLNILGKTILFITITDIANHKNIRWYQEFYVADQLSHKVFMGGIIF